MFKKLSKKDAFQSIFLMLLSIVSIVLGVLISTKVLKLVQPLANYYLPFGITLIVVGTLCLLYSILIITIVALKYRK